MRLGGVCVAIGGFDIDLGILDGEIVDVWDDGCASTACVSCTSLCATFDEGEAKWSFRETRTRGDEVFRACSVRMHSSRKLSRR